MANLRESCGAFVVEIFILDHQEFVFNGDIFLTSGTRGGRGSGVND